MDGTLPTPLTRSPTARLERQRSRASLAPRTRRAPWPPSIALRRRGVWQELKRFARSSLMGIAASVVDFTTLVVCARAFAVDPIVAKGIALLLGSATQFIGSRHFAFRARAGRLGRQLRLYVLAEVCATLLTLLVFRVMLRTFHLPLELANLLTGPVVHIGFSYPVWKRIFATPQAPAAASTLPAAPHAGADVKTHDRAVNTRMGARVPAGTHASERSGIRRRRVAAHRGRENAPKAAVESQGVQYGFWYVGASGHPAAGDGALRSVEDSAARSGTG